MAIGMSTVTLDFLDNAVGRPVATNNSATWVGQLSANLPNLIEVGDKISESKKNR